MATAVQPRGAQFDEHAYLATIMEQALEPWFYAIRTNGQLVDGISVVGARELARLRAEMGFAIRLPIDQVRTEETTENGERGIRATVVARDYRSGAEGMGESFYPHYADRQIEDVQGNVVGVEKEFDRFAGRKALGVAERNAILSHIPEHIVNAVLKARVSIVADNKKRRADEALAALTDRLAAKIVLACTQAFDDPYSSTPSVPVALAVPPAAQPVSGTPSCPRCGGEMMDQRTRKRHASSPDFKCMNAKKERAGTARGCRGVIWPPRKVN